MLASSVVTIRPAPDLVVVCHYLAWTEENRFLPEERKTSVHKTISVPASQSIPFSSRMPRSQLGCRGSQMIHLPPPSTQTSGCTWHFSSCVAQHFDQISEWLDNKTQTSWILPAQSVGLHTICLSPLRSLQASRSAERSSPGGIAAKQRSRYDSGQ